jgi:hypothetical protein
MLYEYDFGDGWQHEILLEKVSPCDPTVRYPRCLDGARACPPEDCNGMGGYMNFLETISDPGHEEHEECLDWIGGEFDAEKFDAAEFQNDLKNMLEFAGE